MPPLAPYHVIDLTDDGFLFAGQLLADLGCDVAVVEPPRGLRARQVSPWADGEAGIERSLTWHAYNRGKRSVVIDLESAEGQRQLLDLMVKADIVLESHPLGYLERLGLGYEAVRESNPGVVYVAMSPFGQDGPKAGWPASDLTVLAASGVLHLTGDSDRAPSAVTVPQAYLHAASEAVVGALIALHHRNDTGIGQFIDVSAQQAAMIAGGAAALAPGWNDQDFKRSGGGVLLGGVLVRVIYECADGHVSITAGFGSALGRFTRRMFELIHSEGLCDEATRDKDWIGYPLLVKSGEEPPSEVERVFEAVAAWAACHTKDELFQYSFDHSILIVPVSTTEDVLHSKQLAETGYWREVELACTRRRARVPGPFARLSATPIENTASAPGLGEQAAHEVLERWSARREVARADGEHAGAEHALTGLKVLDLMWVAAGPWSTRYLADYGATVVKVESALALDALRTLNPMKNSQAGAERSGGYATVNAGKLGLQLNLRTEEGRALARKLVAWADVVTDSFAPGAMTKFGLDYEHLKAINPGIIQISSCLNGQSGPHSTLAGYGTMGGQLAGFGNLVGSPDRSPTGPFYAYSDFISPKLSAIAILSALDHRRRTGEGQFIDFSQVEGAIHFLTPAILDYTVNNHVQQRNGTTSPDFAPYGMYAAAGADAWVAITVLDDRHWRALCSVIGGPLDDPRFRSLPDRLACRGEVDALVDRWTSTRTCDEIEAALAAAGVPVHRAAHPREVYEDPQLAHRKHFLPVEHPELGSVPIESSRLRLSRTPARTPTHGPMYGEHNEQVLRELLGLRDDEIVELAASGALQ